MDKNRFAAAYMAADLVASAVAWTAFNALRFGEMGADTGFADMEDYLAHQLCSPWGAMVVGFWLGLYWLVGGYDEPLRRGRVSELTTTLTVAVLGSLAIFFVMVLNDLPRQTAVYYDLLFALFALQLLTGLPPRLWLTAYGRRRMAAGDWATRTLIICAEGRADRLMASLTAAEGVKVCGLVHQDKPGALADLPRRMAEGGVDELIVAVDTADRSAMDLLYSLYAYERPVKLLAEGLGLPSRARMRTIRGLPLLDMADNGFSPLERHLKLCMDKLLSAVGLLALSPLMAYVAWRVWRSSPGGVFFRQERIGYMGRPFTIYKFRTMYADAEANGPLLATADDPRITPFGRTMRKYRLDELPQLWNVLRGDMSLVGPRPERKHFIDQIVRVAPAYCLLHNVRPGLTSLGMVKYGYAGSVDQMVERLSFDLLYYENMSLGMDLTILLYTVRTVLTGRGV